MIYLKILNHVVKKMDVLDNWELFKNEIKDMSKKFASAMANQRKAQIQINKEIRENCNSQQILDRLDIIDKEIKDFNIDQK